MSPTIAPEQLDHLGIDISAGQLNGILTRRRTSFTTRRPKCWWRGWRSPTTCRWTTREPGTRGTTASVPTSATIVRLLREHRQQEPPEFPGGAPRTRHRLHDQRRGGGLLAAARLAQAVIEHSTRGASWFADEAAWKAYLAWHAVTSERHVRIATEGALLGSLIAHGVSPEMGVLSDGAGQFDVFVHALCWLHVERPLERLVPHNEKHRQAIERIRQRIWDCTRA